MRPGGELQIVGELPDPLEIVGPGAPSLLARFDGGLITQEDRHAREVRVRIALVSLAPKSQHHLVGPPPPKRRRPLETANGDPTRVVSAAGGEDQSTGKVLVVEPWALVQVRVREFEPAVHAELRGDLAEHPTDPDPAVESLELLGIDPVGIGQDLAEADGARAADAYRGIDPIGAVGRRRRCRLREAVPVEAGQEEEGEPVGHDRPAEREAELLPREGIEPSAVGVAAREPWALVIAIQRPAPGVRSRPGDRADQPAGEVAVPDVVRRGHELDLLQRLRYDGEVTELTLGAGNAPEPVGAAAAQAVVGGPVHQDAVERTVLARERQLAVGARGDEGREDGEASEIPPGERQSRDGGVGESERWSRATGVELGRPAHHAQLGQRHRGGCEIEVEPGAPSLGQHKVAALDRREAERPRLDAVGPTHGEVLHRVPAP